MADQNIKDFTVNWVLFGVLFFSLMIFTLSFMYSNNQDALGDAQGNFEIYSSNLSSNLLELEEGTNEQLNISSIIESEDIDIGSRVAASNSYGFFSTGKTFWESSKGFISWMFAGTSGEILVGVFSGLIGIIALFFIFKLGRSLF